MIRLGPVSRRRRRRRSTTPRQPNQPLPSKSDRTAPRHQPAALRAFLESRWNWPTFDPEACQECGCTIPLHETAWLRDQEVYCDHCYHAFEQQQRDRADLAATLSTSPPEQNTTPATEQNAPADCPAADTDTANDQTTSPDESHHLIPTAMCPPLPDPDSSSHNEQTTALPPSLAATPPTITTSIALNTEPSSAECEPAASNESEIKQDDDAPQDRSKPLNETETADPADPVQIVEPTTSCDIESANESHCETPSNQTCDDVETIVNSADNIDDTASSDEPLLRIEQEEQDREPAFEPPCSKALSDPASQPNSKPDLPATNDAPSTVELVDNAVADMMDAINSIGEQSDETTIEQISGQTAFHEPLHPLDAIPPLEMDQPLPRDADADNRESCMDKASALLGHWMQDASSSD